MRVYLFICLSLSMLLLSGKSPAAVGYTSGVGHFYAMEDDNLSFIKEQLIYNAFRDILTNELKALSLDADNFWLAYDSKFEDSFKVAKERLEEKYLPKTTDEDGKEVVDDPDGKKLESFNKTLRKAHLNMKRKFMRIGKVMTKWVVTKRISRSTTDPKHRSIALKGKVNRRMLIKIYDRIMDRNNVRKNKQLYISIDFILDNADWSDFGVDSRKEFIMSIGRFWKDWFEKQKMEQIDEVRIVENDLETKLLKHVSLSHEDLKDESDSIRNGLWLKINYKISKLEMNVLVDEMVCKLVGDMILLNLMDNNAIYDKNVEAEEKIYKFSNKQKLMEDISRSPLEHFSQLTKAIASVEDKTFEILNVENVANVGDLYDLMKFIVSKGIRIDLTPEFKTYQISKASLLINYQGSTKDFENFLHSLKNAQLKSGNVIKLGRVSSPYTIRLEGGM